MRARLKRLKLVKFRYMVDKKGGVNGVLIRFASVGFDGSLGCQGIKLSSDLISDPDLFISIQ